MVMGVYFAAHNPRDVELLSKIKQAIKDKISFSDFVKWMLEDRNLILENKKSKLHNILK
jgi:hypothetical protein